MLGVVVSVLAVVYKGMQLLLAVCKETVCNAFAWPQTTEELGKWRRLGDHGTNESWELLAQNFDRFQTLFNNSHVYVKR